MRYDDLKPVMEVLKFIPSNENDILLTANNFFHFTTRILIAPSKWTTWLVSVVNKRRQCNLTLCAFLSWSTELLKYARSLLHSEISRLQHSRYKNMGDTTLLKIFRKMNLPSPSRVTFHSKHLRDLVATMQTPCKIVNCLHFHREYLECCNLDISECNKLLAYFNNSVDQLKHCCHQVS
jgi:hypothetical protein